MGDTQNASKVGLITPTYWRDLERCALLCESVDRHVTRFARHYLIVADDDMRLFAKFRTDRRVVLPLSDLLPRWLKPLPKFLRRRSRRFWGSFRAAPVNGWHVQQFAKIAMASTMSEDRACMLDSEVVFFRPFDASVNFGQNNLSPLYFRPRTIVANAPLHAPWVHSCHRLLGLGRPRFPAHDFIGPVIYWDQTDVRAMTARIEAVTELEWLEALCRARSISEYMLYGYFVLNNADAMRRHRLTTKTLCSTYWDTEPLDETAIEHMLRTAGRDQPAFLVQSFSNTPVSRIRAVLHRLQDDAAEPLAPLAPQMDLAPADELR